MITLQYVQGLREIQGKNCKLQIVKEVEVNWLKPCLSKPIL